MIVAIPSKGRAGKVRTLKVLPSATVLAERVVLATVSDPLSEYIPPPDIDAEFGERVELVMANMPVAWYMPPPLPLVALFAESVELVSVSAAPLL